jgi:hypothetical protein
VSCQKSTLSPQTLTATKAHGKKAHRLDPTTKQGLIDVVTLGNCLELAKTFDIRDFPFDDGDESDCEVGIPALEAVQREALFQMYSAFQDRFCDRFVLEVDKKLLDPWAAFFKPTLLNLAVSIYKYKEIHDAACPSIPSKGVRDRLETHFRINRPMMLGELLGLMDKPIDQLPFCQTFEWIGPDFTIVPKPPGFAADVAPGHIPDGSLPAPPLLTEPTPPPASPTGASASTLPRGKRKRDDPAGRCCISRISRLADLSAAGKVARRAKRK